MIQREGRFRDVLIVAGTVILMLGAFMAIAARPGTAQTATAYRAPRLPGTTQPDLNGIWQALTTAHDDLEEHEAQPRVRHAGARPGQPAVPAASVLALGTLGVVAGGMSVVDGGTIPYQRWAAAKRKDNFENSLARDPEVKCFLPGVPRAMYLPHPFQIVHTPNTILMAFEYADAVRRIHMNTMGPSPVDTWMGQSTGRWDGGTLTIDTTGFNGQAWFDHAGNFASEALHVVERLTRTDADHLMYEATLDDPNVFTRPWTIRMPLYRRVEARAQLVEYNCVPFVEELMYGHLRREQLVRHWEADYGPTGGTLSVEITRRPSEIRER